MSHRSGARAARVRLVFYGALVWLLSMGTGDARADETRVDTGGAGADQPRGDAATSSASDFIELGLVSPDSALVATLRGIAGEPLRLADAVLQGLENATEARDAEAAMRAADASLRRERGAFDPELFASFERTSDELPSANVLAGAAVVIDEASTTVAGARMSLPFGTDLALTFNTLRSETNSAFAALVPEYRTDGRFEVRQPLLRGFGPGTGAVLSATEWRFEAARAQYVDAILSVRAEIEATYWELYAAERDYAVATVIAERAAAFVDLARVRSDAGLVGPNEVANAQVFQAQQELLELDQLERLDAVSDRLATLMARRPVGRLPRYRSVDEPPAEFALEDVEALVERATVHNGELESARAELDAARVAAHGARWNAYPTLDLVGSIGANGLGGTGRDVVFGGDTLMVDIDSGVSDAWRQVGDFDFRSWRVGVELEVPIGARADGGERDRLRAEADRSEQELLRVERELEEQVRDNHRRLEYGARRLEMARLGVEASLEQVRVGFIEYNNGRTTAFELVRLGSDLATAQLRFSQALVRTATAAAELRRLTADGFADTAAFVAPEGEDR